MSEEVKREHKGEGGDALRMYAEDGHNDKSGHVHFLTLLEKHNGTMQTILNVNMASDNTVSKGTINT